MAAVKAIRIPAAGRRSKRARISHYRGGSWKAIFRGFPAFSRGEASGDAHGSAPRRAGDKDPGDAGRAGLVTTDKGAATPISRGRQAAVTEFSREGAIVSEAPVPCHGPEALLSLWAIRRTYLRMARSRSFRPEALLSGGLRGFVPGPWREVCPMGGLRSWIRKPASGSAAVAPAPIPETERAVASTRRPGHHHGAFGLTTGLWPPVVKVSNDGRLPGRAATSSFHRIAVPQGYLFLGSVTGEIFVFKL